MKTPFSLLITVVALVVLFPGHLLSIDGIPAMTVVNPDTAKSGDLVSIEGSNLGKTNVAGLFLTDGSKDWKCDIVEQSEGAIKFKVPANTEKGRLALMILTAGKDAKLLELPNKLTVE